MGVARFVSSVKPGKPPVRSGKSTAVIRPIAAKPVSTAKPASSKGAPSGPPAIGHATANSYEVFVGYADSLRPNPVNFPTPWDGSPSVMFEGCATACSGGLDSSAVEIINNGTGAEMFQSVVISFSSACVYDIWPHNVSLPKNDELVITENVGGGPGGCTVGTGQMDGSDIGPGGANWAGNQSGIIPSVAVTENNTLTTLNDTGQVLNTGGIDANSCGHPNESEQWTPIGDTVCYGATLTTTPASQAILPSATATINAKLLNSCGDPLQGVDVTYTVASGPDAGVTQTVETSATGAAKFTYTDTGAVQGIDIGQATVTNTAGTISSNLTYVFFEKASLSLTPSTGLPGTVVNFTGSGYGDGEAVNLYGYSAAGPELTHVTASGTGTISGTFTVPVPTAGEGAMSEVVAQGQTTGNEGWALFASSCTDNWTNTAGGNWTTAADWSTGSVPSGFDIACVIASGTYTVMVNNNETVGGVIVGSTLASSGTQTVDVQAAGAGVVTLSAPATTINKHGVVKLDSIDADQNAFLTGGTITNSGTLSTVQDNGGARYIRENVVNNAGATVSLGANLNYFDQGYTFTNKGSLTVAAGTVFETNGNAVFTESGGTITNGGTFYAVSTTFNQTSGSESGNPIVLQSTTLNDAAGGGSFVAQCDNSLSGTIPAGQSVQAQANGCGSATLTLLGNVDNKGTLSLDSISADNYAYLNDSVPAGSLTNDGTFETILGNGSTRFIRLNVTNNADGTVTIGGADTRFDQGYSFTNNGPMTILPGAQFETNGNAVFTDTGATTNNGVLYVLSTTFNLAGSAISGNAAIVQGTTLNDTGGTGSFILQCTNYLSGTIAAGQTMTAQSNGCGTASLVLLGNVTNHGILSLDSVDADANTFITDSVSADTLTNDGTFRTLQDAGANRYIRLNVVNDADGTVSIGAANTIFDQGYAFTNNGSFTVTSTGGYTQDGGSGTFIQSGGTFVNNGSTFFQNMLLTLSGGAVSGNAVVVQNSDLTDSAGGGSFVLQCGNNLAGTIPSGQTIDVQANACGSASLQLQGNVTNHGTLNLDSIDADNNSLMNDSIGGDGLINSGTFQTLAGAGGIRYIRAPITNNAGKTINLFAANNYQDQNTADTNNGNWNVKSGAELFMSSSSTFTQSSTGNFGAAVNVALATAYGISGGSVLLAGKVTVTTAGTPASGSQWVIISTVANGVVGTFSSVAGPIAYTPSYTSTQVILTAP